MTQYTNFSDDMQTIFSYGGDEKFPLCVTLMDSAPKNRLRAELIAIRKELGFSMEDMAKALGFSGSSGYQYYEDENGYTKEYFDFNFLKRLRKLIPLGISEKRINDLGPPGIGGPKIYNVDSALMDNCIAAIINEAREQGRELSIAQGVQAAVSLYNHVMQYREKNKTLQPDEALANLILKQISA